MSLSSIIDLAVILIVLVSAGVSFFRGFVREVLTIFGVIGGGFAAFIFGPRVAPVLKSWMGVVDGEKAKKLFDIIPYDILAVICAYAGIFILVFLILQLISYFLSASVKAIGLGPVDRSLGVVFGIARAFLFLGILYAALNQFIPDEVRKDVLGKSKTIVYVEAVADWLSGFWPEETKDKAKDSVKNSAEDTRDQLKAAGEKLKDSGQELKDKVDRKLDEKKDQKLEDQKLENRPSENKSPGYTPQERNKMNTLIDQQTGEGDSSNE